MAKGPKKSFEIHILHQGRWVLESVADVEKQAQEHAVELLKNWRTEGVRVIQERRRLDGEYTEKVLFENVRQARKERDISLSEIASAPACNTAEDFHRLNSRTTANRLFRKYLDESVLTPTEMLHNFREMKRLLSLDIASKAMSRVATLQARAGGGDPRERQEVLQGLVDGLYGRLRQYGDGKDLPDVYEVGLDGVLGTLDPGASAADRGFLARIALARRLADMRSWPSKMTEVLAQMEQARSAEAQALLDGVLADTCAATGVVGDLVGPAPNLGTFLLRLFDLLDGRLPDGASPPDEIAAGVAKRLAAGQVSETRAVVLDHGLRHLKGGQPLARNEPGLEEPLFRDVVRRLVSGDGVLGGAETIEALIERQLHFQRTGGVPGRSDAIRALTGLLPAVGPKLRLLAAIAASPLGAEQASTIAAILEEVIGRARRMKELVHPGAPFKQMAEMKAVQDMITAMTLLAPPVRQRLADQVDELLCQFIIDNQIIERLDRPEDSLRDRAIRLVRFCGSGMLTAGQAALLARERVLALLRQPHFEVALIAGITDAKEQERVLREFDRLLITAGFKRDKTG